jgi:hypothetical protein
MMLQDVSNAQLGSWYPIWLFFVFGLADFSFRWTSVPPKALIALSLLR